MRPGTVDLTFTDLDRSVAFYGDAIGLQVHHREDGTAALGAGGEDLLVLTEDAGARRAGRHAGLYHVALLHPSRDELARAVARLAVTRTPIEGASDHGISEAIYLPDPDGNGLELAADRPRDVWPDLSSPDFDMAPRPLDLYGLLAVAGDGQPPAHADPRLSVGHVHLHVGDLEASTRFYRDVLGFDVTMRMPTAVFVSSGGYHHHVGFNVWRGAGAPPAPEHTVGLRRWTLVVDDEDQLAAIRERAEAASLDIEDEGDGALLRDPSRNAVLIAPPPRR